METVTITATHVSGYSPLAILALAAAVIGIVAWQLVVRARGSRSREG